MTADPSKRSAASAAMLDACAKGRALMGGTAAMRAAGETYLMRFSAESEDNYRKRLGQSWLFNGYRKTVRDMTGRVFAKPVEVQDSPPEALVDWCENIDLAGRDLSIFARQVFTDALSGPGISWIMVDAPRRDGVVSQAQAKAQNLRPYLTALRIEDVLGWRSEVIANAVTLTQIRIAETVDAPDPADEFASVAIEQVRVMDLIEGRVSVRLYRREKSNGGAGKWALFEEFPTDLAAIPVVPVYLNRTGFYTAAPVLDDLADVNIAHWQSQSDQRNLLQYARVPILFGAGMDEKAPITIGGGAITKAASPDAKLMFVEHSGGAIGAGRQDLKDLEFQMEAHGLQLLVAADGAQSATGEALDARKETSQLAMMADALRDALEGALAMACEIGGLSGYIPSVFVTDEFGVAPFAAQDLMALLQAVQTGNLSRATFLEELVRRGAVRSDVVPDEELDRIAEDQMGGTPEPAGEMLAA